MKMNRLGALMFGNDIIGILLRKINQLEQPFKCDPTASFGDTNDATGHPFEQNVLKGDKFIIFWSFKSLVVLFATTPRYLPPSAPVAHVHSGAPLAKKISISNRGETSLAPSFIFFSKSGGEVTAPPIKGTE